VDGQVRQRGYDYLIVASGAVDSYFGHDQWAAHSYPMKTLAQAVALRDRILGAYERAACASDVDAQREWTSFALVGAGPTGVELAGRLATLAHQLHRQFHTIDTEQTRITLINAGPDVLAAFPATLRVHTHRTLTGVGVDVRLGARAIDVDDTGVTVKTHDGATERISARTVIWTAGVVASALGRLLGKATGAPVDHHGRVRVNADCSLPGHPRVFAIGDVANHDDLPGLAEPAMQQGWYVARRIRAQVAGRAAPGPFRYRDLGTMATISPSDAVADVFGLKLSGVPAKIAWAGVHVAFLPGGATGPVCWPAGRQPRPPTAAPNRSCSKRLEAAVRWPSWPAPTSRTDVLLSGRAVACGAVAVDQFVGGAVVGQAGRVVGGQLVDDGVGEDLAQFHAPLVEGVDVPGRALGEHLVFIQRGQATQAARG
jgi:NADH:ubiquinone reductase (H+-translocating)